MVSTEATQSWHFSCANSLKQEFESLTNYQVVKVILPETYVNEESSCMSFHQLTSTFSSEESNIQDRLNYMTKA